MDPQERDVKRQGKTTQKAQKKCKKYGFYSFWIYLWIYGPYVFLGDPGKDKKSKILWNILLPQNKFNLLAFFFLKK